MINLSTTNPATRWGVNAVLLLGMVLALWLGRSIFLPTILSLLLAAMLFPVVAWLNQPGFPIVVPILRDRFPWLVPGIVRLRLSWNVSSFVVVIAFVLLSLLIVTGFGVAMSKFVIDMGSESKLKEVYNNFRRQLVRVSPQPIPENDVYFHKDPEQSEVYKKVASYLRADNPNFRGLMTGALELVGSVLWHSILITFVLLFLLMEEPLHSRHLVRIFGPTLAVRSKVVLALSDIGAQIRAYLVWRTVINVVFAIILGLIYYLAGLSQPWTWALLIVLLWYVPYIGPILAGVPAILDAFLFCDPLWAFGILILYTVLVTIEGYLVVPLLMGRHMELNATTVMLACLFWELVWGLTGLFLAMPLMAAVRTICRHIPDLEPWADLMGTQEASDRPAVLPEEDTQIITAREMQGVAKSDADADPE